MKALMHAAYKRTDESMLVVLASFIIIVKTPYQKDPERQTCLDSAFSLRTPAPAAPSEASVCDSSRSSHKAQCMHLPEGSKSFHRSLDEATHHVFPQGMGGRVPISPIFGRAGAAGTGALVA